MIKQNKNGIPFLTSEEREYADAGIYIYRYLYICVWGEGLCMREGGDRINETKKEQNCR